MSDSHGHGTHGAGGHHGHDAGHGHAAASHAPGGTAVYEWTAVLLLVLCTASIFTWIGPDGDFQWLFFAAGLSCFCAALLTMSIFVRV